MTTDAKVQKVIQQCERRIKALTQNNAVMLVTFYKKKESCFSFDEICDIVCSVTSVTFEEALNKRRKRHLVMTRQLISFFAKLHCKMNSVDIAEKFDQDHSTVLSSITKVTEWIETGDEKVCEAIRKINLIINKLNSK